MATKHEQSQQPNSKPLSLTRRSALKKMLVGTGVAAGAAALPDKWAKPVVDKVMVPAHAQTSPGGRAKTYFDNRNNKGMSPNGYYIPINATVIGNIVKLEFVDDRLSPQKQSTLFRPENGTTTPPPEPRYRNEYSADVDVTGLPRTKAIPYTTPPTASGPIMWEGGCDSPGRSGDAIILNINDEIIDVEIWTNRYTLFDVPSLTRLPGVDCGEPSDIRLKTEIHPLGVTNQGFKLYRFRYIKDPAKHEYVGVMAQDLTDSHPHALVKNDNGYYAVRYDLLGIKMATYKEWQQAGLKAVELSH